MVIRKDDIKVGDYHISPVISKLAASIITKRNNTMCNEDKIKEAFDTLKQAMKDDPHGWQ